MNYSSEVEDSFIEFLVLEVLFVLLFALFAEFF